MGGVIRPLTGSAARRCLAGITIKGMNSVAVPTEKERDVADIGGPLSIDDMKRDVACAALDFVEPGSVVGVGSGTTTWAFVEALAEGPVSVAGAVAASDETARRLAAIRIPVFDFSPDMTLNLYVDGADQVDMSGRAVKGGGAAHTREKALASVSEYWVCIVDASKVVRALQDAKIPLEVLPEAVDFVREALRQFGATVVVRHGVLTDAGNPVLDARGLSLADPNELEETLDAIPGVVGSGLFARRRADLILVGRADGGVGRIVPNRERA